MTDGPWVGEGKTNPQGGRQTRTFTVCDDDSNTFRVTEYLLIIPSQRVHADAQNRASPARSYSKLADGRYLLRHKSEPKTFKIVGTETIVWEIP